MASVRQRSCSEREEKNISEFIEATLNFQSKVTFGVARDAKDVKNVLLLGTSDQLAAADLKSLSFCLCHPLAFLSQLKQNFHQHQMIMIE